MFEGIPFLVGVKGTPAVFLGGPNPKKKTPPNGPVLISSLLLVRGVLHLPAFRQSQPKRGISDYIDGERGQGNAEEAPGSRGDGAEFGGRRHGSLARLALLERAADPKPSSAWTFSADVLSWSGWT